jgi:O-methyltransferase
MQLDRVLKGIARNILPERVTRALRCLVYPERFAYLPGLTYCEDGMACIRNTAVLHEPRFKEAYAIVKASGAWRGCEIRWRAYVVAWCAQKAAALPGDFVECGVNEGGFSRLAMHCIGFDRMPERTFFLLDTYCGTPPEAYSPGEDPDIRHTYSESYDRAKTMFSGFPNARLIRGEVPGTLDQITSDRICYLSLDMNVARPEIAAAQRLWDRLVPGAPVILDDYNWIGYEEQKKAFDLFATERGVEVLALPTGQGLIFKP